MGKIKMLVGDTDGAYVEALMRYMIGTDESFSVSGFTDPEMFVSDMSSSGGYQAALLNRPFLEKLKDNPEISDMVGKVFYLSDHVSDEAYGYERLYKFQSMQSFISRIRSTKELMPKTGAEQHQRSRQRIISVLSPMHHELTLPFAMSICRILGEKEQTLLIDMEQISILPDLLERNNSRDLMDFIYLLEGGCSDPEKLMDFLGFYEGFYYLPPAGGIEGSASVTVDEWEKLIEIVKKTEFSNIVMVFDSMVQGMNYLMSISDDIMLPTRAGDYYEKSTRIFCESLTREGYAGKAKKIIIPMSAGNLTDGHYQMRQLLNGGLSGLARNNIWERMNAVG